MKGLLYKETAGILGLYRKNLILVAVVYGVMTILMENDFFIYFGVWMMSFYSLSGFSLDESSGWGRYARTLPVSDRDVVTAKFLASLIFVGAGAVYALIVGGIRTVLTHDSFAEMLLALAMIVATVIAVTAVLLLLAVKFGPEKARNYYVIFFLVAFGVLILLAKAGLLGGGNEVARVLVWIEQHPWLPVILAAAAAAVIAALCWAAACTVYRKKEF